MSFCNYCEECFFFCDPIIDCLTDNAEYLRRKYCARDFTNCAIYTLANSSGIHNVPGIFSPDVAHYSKPLATNLRYSPSPIMRRSLNRIITVKDSPFMASATGITHHAPHEMVQKLRA